MSAFYDIWISKAKPQHRRLGNTEWANRNEFSINTWVSLPDEDFFQQFANERATIIVIGQFYENVVLANLLHSCLQYIDGNINHLNEPAGHYLLLIHEKKQQQYHVFTNRLGTYHAYWSCVDGINTLSTYYIGLAKQATTKVLDWEGITGFMAMGFFPGNTTYLEGISILEPASHYVFDEHIDMLSHSRYWGWTHEPQEQKTENLFEEFDNILTDILTVAVKDKHIALPLSGGLDSRTLAGVLGEHAKEATSVWSYAYGYNKTSQEIKIASKIAQAEHFEFNACVVPDYLFDKASLITDAVELFQYIDGTRQACMTEILADKADLVIGGHWGDVWMGDMGMDALTPEQFFSKKIVKKGSDWLLKEVCKPHYANYDSLLKNYFNSWTYKYRHITDADFRMKIFKTDQWSFRWTVPSLRMYQAAVMPVLPFYDKRIVDFFSKIPTAVVKDRNFQIEYLKAYHPGLAKITWQEYDSNLYNYKKYNNRNIGYRAIKKIQRLLSTNKPIIRNREVFYLNDNGRKNLEDILLNNPAFTDVVATDTIKELITDFYDYPNAANGYKISMMHTFAQFMKTVFG